MAIASADRVERVRKFVTTFLPKPEPGDAVDHGFHDRVLGDLGAIGQLRVGDVPPRREGFRCLLDGDALRPCQQVEADRSLATGVEGCGTVSAALTPGLHHQFALANRASHGRHGRNAN